MKRTLLFILITILLLGATASPALSQGIEAQPEVTTGRGEGSENAVVHAVLFWMDGCPHCHDVLDHVLPPLEEKYGAQLEITLVEIKSQEDFDGLLEVADSYGIPKERVGVPFLIIGDQVLIGSGQIQDQLPGLIETHLEQGGVALPALPVFSDRLPGSQAGEGTSTVPSDNKTRTETPDAVLTGILFTSPGCQDCQLITEQIHNLTHGKYQDLFAVETIKIITSADVDYLHQVTAQYGLSEEEVELPLIIVNDQILVNEKIPYQLPGLIEQALQEGAEGSPQLPERAGEGTAEHNPTPASAAGLDSSPATFKSGFTLAIVIMVLMAASLIYSLAAVAVGKSVSLPPWTDWLIPVLILIGLGVAGYLSYVETQPVEAICGPVGDCNTVQNSPYAILFGVLPVGVLGFLGFLGLLAAWAVRRWVPGWEILAGMVFWIMAFFAVIFSLYLTYLEPFVIHAVCSWCLTSSVIVTLLLLLGTPPVVRFTSGTE